ncbi:MAG: hypothetical protein LBH79_06420 [Nitrososphaerota archaeon]|nr:hypothetical protein [Nitrososphaerota archaeon]
MSLGTSQVFSYPQNSLRFGLLDLKPVEITEDVKFGNVRCKVTKTKLEPTKPVSTFEELVTADNNMIFNSISIPERFNVSDLVKAFTDRSVKLFEEDKALQQEIENTKRLDRNRPFYTFVSFMKQRFEKERDNRLALDAKRFLMSNLPLTFYNQLTRFDNTCYDFLKFIQNTTRIYEYRAKYSRNSKMFTKIIKNMQSELGPIINKFDECAYACTRLRRYVIIWNADTTGDLNWPKFLDIKKIEISEFEQLNQEFNTKLHEIRLMLLNDDTEVLCKISNTPNSTVNMIGNLLGMSSATLNGGS